jgi:hypothetical protein
MLTDSAADGATTQRSAREEDHEGSGAAGKNNLLKEEGRGDRFYGVEKGRCIRQ